MFNYVFYTSESSLWLHSVKYLVLTHLILPSHTPCSKKVIHQAHIDNLVNSQRIFIIPSLAHSLLENLR